MPDDVAAATMERHHELLAAGVPSDEALARAVDEIDDVAAAFLNLGGRYQPDRDRSQADPPSGSLRRVGAGSRPPCHLQAVGAEVSSACGAAW